MSDCNKPRPPYSSPSRRKKEGGFLGLHKQDFNAHISGEAYRHCATQIKMYPELSGCGMGENVQQVLENLLFCLNNIDTGGLDIPSVESVVTTNTSISDVTEKVHRIFPVDVTSGQVTVQLPSTPFSEGEIITIKHWDGSVDFDNIVIDPNGNDIDGASSSDIISNTRDAKTYQWDENLSSWILR